MEQKNRQLLQKMDGIYNILEKISLKFVLVACALIGVIFTIGSGISSNVFPADYSQEMAKAESDFLLLNIVVCIGWVILIWGLYKLLSLGVRGDEKKLQKRLHLLMIILCALLGAALMVWIYVAHYTMIADQWTVYSITLEFMEGDYNAMLPGHYIFYYPHQLNQVLLYQILFSVFHTQSYRLLQYINIISIVLTIYFGYRIVKELTVKPVIQIGYMIFGFTFIPLLLYSQFVYGDVFILAMANIGIWALLCWSRNKRVRYVVTMVLTVLIGSLVRLNYGVILIAMSIGLLYHAVKAKYWRSLLVIALCVAALLGPPQLVKIYYEYKSGLDVCPGVPMSYRLYSAMEDNPDGPGTYTNQLILDFAEIAELDYVYFDQIFKAALEDRKQYLWENPDELLDFYWRKLMQQWNDHTFSSAYATYRADGKQIGDFEQSVYYGSIKSICDWYMDRYLFVLYLSFVAGSVALWRQKRELCCYISLIAIIGGFLFSILFETKGRYVMPYVILMQPFAAIGLEWILLRFEHVAERISARALKKA